MNRRVLLKQRPKGMPVVTDFEITETAIPSPATDEVLVKNRFLSLDPYMRGQMDGGKSYIQAIDLGDVMNGHTVGEVILSNNSAFAPGDLVWGPGHWQEYALIKSPPLRKITGLPSLSAWLGPMGLPGWTAYIGLSDFGTPTQGETIVISSATGAVGALVGQLAKSLGLHVVGIAGGTKKCRYAVEHLGYDECIDYKAENFPAQLANACPNGIDIDFENVGGPILDAVWPLLNSHSRVIVCGLMAQYNLISKYPGPDMTQLLKSRINMRGFIISDHFARIPEAIARMSELVAVGKIKFKEDITIGIENAPEAFIGMLQGANFGKTLVELK